MKRKTETRAQKLLRMQVQTELLVFAGAFDAEGNPIIPINGKAFRDCTKEDAEAVAKIYVVATRKKPRRSRKVAA